VRACPRARALEELEAFDDAYGTDTGRTLTAVDLGADGDDVPALWRYWPTLRSSFSSIIEALPIRYEERVFVDLGSGKGRALLLASEHPFAKIIGVELSPALHRIAERNVRLWRSPAQRCHAIELVCMNARDWVPPTAPTLIYLFQPFPVEIMHAVLARLAGRLQAAPRARIQLAYLNPLHHALVVGSGAFELARWGRAAQKGAFDWAIYHSLAATPAR
jgi:SAM-dependent methyltransferase